MSGCPFGRSNDSTPTPDTGMATPGLGGQIKPDSSVTSKPLGFAQDKALSPGGLGEGNTATPNGMWSDKGAWTSNKQLSGEASNGGFGNAMRNLMIARNPGLAGLMGSVGVPNMPTMGDLWAHMTQGNSQQNKPTQLIGMANPATMAAQPYMQDPAAQQGKGGGSGMMGMLKALI